ncbi:hypothetical protein BJ742DRAFT_773479 [Cladochytrium replicatum]|nr:hypothetical protein BJ742DRAFT_773479 [Cladochytrium replicatum]
MRNSTKTSGSKSSTKSAAIRPCDRCCGLEHPYDIGPHVIEYGQGPFAHSVTEKFALIGFRTYNIVGSQTPPLPIIDDRTRVARQYIEDEIERSIETVLTREL